MAPIVANQTPAHGSSGISLSSTITFDIVEPGGGSGINLAKTNISLDRGGTPATVMTNGVAQPGYGVVATPIVDGYQYVVTPAVAFNYSQIETVTVSGENNTAVSTGTSVWSFMTIPSAVQHRKPYITAESPFDGAVNIATNSHIIFTIKTDDTTTPATSIKQNEYIRLNGITIISNGVNVLPGQYSVTLTPSLRQVIVDILPLAGLTSDTVYTVDGTFEDDVGNVGLDNFQFSTGNVQFAVQIDRTEPLLCPIDNIPLPLFTTNPDVQTSAFSDTVQSYTTDWTGYGLSAYDAVEITDGPDAGRWLVRQPGLTQARLYHTFKDTSTTRQVLAYIRREFADRNPVVLTFSPLIDYSLVKVWGDTQLRYLAGHASDGNFPIAFHEAPASTRHDANDSMVGSATAVDGSTAIVGSTSPNTSFTTTLTPLTSYIRIGNTTEYYQVATIIDNNNITISPAFVYQKVLTGLVSINIGTNALVGVGTNFVAELVPGQRIRLDGDPTTYVVNTITNGLNLTIVGTASQTTTAGYAYAVSLVDQTIHKLDNTCGSTFDDQTNHRLDFSIVCNPPPTLSGAPVPRWDRYSVPLQAKILPVLSETATLTVASSIVAMSGTAYRTELHIGSVVTFGTSSTQYVVTAIDNTLQEFSISPPWGGAAETGETVYRKLTGTRVLTEFHVTDMPPLTEFFVGLDNTSLSPLSAGEDVVGVSFSRNAGGTIDMRCRLGSTVAIRQTGLSHGSFVGKYWILELEFVDEHTVQVRLFDYNDLENGNPNYAISMQNIASTRTFSQWSITTFSDGTADLNHKVTGYVTYVDVEPGHGLPFSLGTGLVATNTAKPRPAKNRTNIPLAGDNDWKVLNVKAGMSSASLTSTQYDRIFWDIDDVVVVIDEFSIEGGVLQVIQGQNRSVKKFSFKQGFDQITLKFRASRRGFWYVIIDGDDPKTDLVVASGLYDVAEVQQSVSLDGDAFGGLADGVHTLNVVICREPVPSSWVVVPAVANMTAIPNLLKLTGAAIFGIATITADASIEAAAEEDIMILEDLSAQVLSGGGATTTFITSVPYKPGKIKLILDGVIQNFNPSASRVVETNNTLGQVTLSTAPRVNQHLVAEYVPL
jgi:hypothetical protein